MKIYSVDSIGEKYAYCEDKSGNTVLIKIENLPLNIKEGDIIEIYENGAIKINISETKKRRSEILKLQSDILN